MARPGGITLAEIAGAGIWLASTVEVFSFTYKAFHDTYVPFPIGTGTGGNAPGSVGSMGNQIANSGSTAAVTKALPGGGYMNDFFGAVRKVAGILGIGGTAKQTPLLEAAGLKGSGLTLPPSDIIMAVVNANNSPNAARTLANAANTLQQWTLGNGWTKAQTQKLLATLGVKLLPLGSQ